MLQNCNKFSPEMSVEPPWPNLPKLSSNKLTKTAIRQPFKCYANDSTVVGKSQYCTQWLSQLSVHYMQCCKPVHSHHLENMLAMLILKPCMLMFSISLSCSSSIISVTQLAHLIIMYVILESMKMQQPGLLKQEWYYLYTPESWKRGTVLGLWFYWQYENPATCFKHVVCKRIKIKLILLWLEKHISNAWAGFASCLC